MNRSDRAQSRRSATNGQWTSLQKLHILRIDQLGWAAKRQEKGYLAVLKNRVGHFLVLRFRQACLAENSFFVVWMPVSAHETNKTSLAGTIQMNCEGTGDPCISLKSQITLFFWPFYCTFPAKWRQIVYSELFLLISSKLTTHLSGSGVRRNEIAQIVALVIL